MRRYQALSVRIEMKSMSHLRTDRRTDGSVSTQS